MIDAIEQESSRRYSDRSPVCVVLCSYQGEKHLNAQLDSIQAQTWPLSVRLHDDASDDNTLAIARAHPIKAEVVPHCQNLGYVKNFERAIVDAVQSGAHYIALSDQDDIWQADRVAHGMQLLQESERILGQDTPLLAHSDLIVVNDAGEITSESYFALRGYSLDDSPALAAVLGQNGVMGNTCLMNRALATLALPFPAGLHVHDWWLALLAELYGRRRLEQRPGVAYRLHADNVSNQIGTVSPSVFRILARLSVGRLLRRDFRLPFKEDTRVMVLESLLVGDGHRPALNDSQRVLVEAFVNYLKLAQPRLRLLVSLLRHGFLRRGWRHRLRVASALFTSGRYDGTRVVVADKKLENKKRV